MAIRNDFAPGEVLAAADLNDTFGSKLDVAGGKILQIVRATDSTNRSTTSTSYVDAGISVTITPQKSDSAVILIWSCRSANQTNNTVVLRITDSSDNAISGAEEALNADDAGTNQQIPTVLIGYATPTTSAVTYKGRFRTNLGTVAIFNASQTGQLFAIEVSA
jgi:hypothetical protein